VSLALRTFLLVSGASVLGALLWLVMRWPPGPLGHIAGAAMILSGAVVAATPLARVSGTGRAIIAASGASLIGGAAEIAGLYHGFFGEYVYTDAWQPAVTLPRGFTFPVLLPVVWFAVLAACYSYTRQRLNAMAAVVTGAVLATTLDLVAESVLTGPVGFWRWLEPAPLLGAPLLNPVGWAITSLVGCAWIALVTRGRRPTGSEPAWMVFGALAGVVIIGTTHGEPRAWWALVPVATLLAFRRRTAA
jgi:uncharacterized membrane protein